MIIIPAIDLRGGRCVRLLRGDYGLETAFGDPLEYAKRWVREGATRLHVVDLDGAREGKPRSENLAVVGAIVKVADVPVQMGGGIRSVAKAEMVLELGVDRVVVGTSIAASAGEARRFFETLGDHVIAGVDARDGRVAVEGWLRETDESAAAFAVRMVELGAQRLIFTDIARDGTQAGPNVTALREVAESVRVPVIASGGVGSLDDILKLRTLAPSNVEGVIVGKALYSGALSLRDAIAALE